MCEGVRVYVCVCRNQQILVCAPSNTAVDQLTEKIHKTGIKVSHTHTTKRIRNMSKHTHTHTAYQEIPRV